MNKEIKQLYILKINIDKNGRIPFEEFELKWRWEKPHNPKISISEINEIQPVSVNESKRLNKVIDYFELEDNLNENYKQTDWISANSENEDKIERFRKQLSLILEPWEEGVIVTWNRTTTLRTTKDVFIKYWDDFCYPSSDDVTVISEMTNWIMFYKHFEVANIWTKIKRTHNRVGGSDQ